jgi:hypothetical protein
MRDDIVEHYPKEEKSDQNVALPKAGRYRFASEDNKNVTTLSFFELSNQMVSQPIEFSVLSRTAPDFPRQGVQASVGITLAQ